MSDLAARLTEASTTVVGALSADEVAAIRRYQALDRTYELVNRLLRGEPRADELSDEQDAAVRNIVRRLNQTLSRWRTPEPGRAYRGMRSRAGLDTSPDGVLVTRSFLSTTIFRDLPSPSSLSRPALTARRSWRSTCRPGRPRFGYLPSVIPVSRIKVSFSCLDVSR